MGGVDSKLTEYLIEGREKEALELYHSNESFNDQINPNARLSKSPGDTPLLCAARYGMKSLLEELLTSGGNPCVANRKNETAFHLVCKFSQSITSSRKSRIRTALLTRLLEHVGCGYQTVAAAAQPNKCTRKDGKSLYYIFLSAQDESLNTPLHLACASGLLECVELLVAYDAPLFVTNVAGQTPCDVAAGAKHVVIAKLLESKMVFAEYYKYLKDSTISEPQGTDADITVIQQQVCTAIIITDRKPKNYLGLPALIYSLEVNSHYAAGRIAQARDASNTAKKLNIGGLIYGTVTIICFIVGAVIPVTVGLIVA